jgi:anti-sigma B factor antagonist
VVKKPKAVAPTFSVLPWTPRDGVIVLTVVGDLDFYTGSLLRTPLLQLASTPPAVIVLDLASLSFIDSTGVGLLIFGLKRARKKDHRFRLAALSPWTSDLLHHMGVLKIFDVFETVEQAIAHSSSQTQPPRPTDS